MDVIGGSKVTSQVIQGDALTALRTLPDESVNCCVTSPPYWGLRDYGTNAQIWGGDPECRHDWDTHRYYRQGGNSTGSSLAFSEAGPENAKRLKETRWRENTLCAMCGAWRGELGGEPTPDLYVQHLVEVFREVRRVLHRTGTLWIVIGDSYSNDAKWGGSTGGKHVAALHGEPIGRAKRSTGLKPKDLIGVPWKLAEALRDPYYTGRIAHERDRVWLAATLDAEGTICGYRHTRSDDGSIRTGANISITNSSMAILDEAQRIWPASRSRHEAHLENSPSHLGSRPTFRWIVHGTENRIAFLREIYPYLIEKRPQAVLAYNLLLLVRDAKRLGHSSQRDAVREKRDVLVKLLSEANHGKIDVPNWCVVPPSLFEPGYYLRSDIIWEKRSTMPESVTDRPTKSHEYVFLLAKSERYYYDADAIREPLATADRKGPRRSYPSGVTASSYDGETGTHVRMLGPQAGLPLNPAGRNKRDVWTLSPDPYPGAHFAVFPEKLVEPCILAGCPEGGTVLDPFAGSGTTLAVAVRLGRSGLGIELNPDYVALAEKRLRGETTPLALFEEDAS